MGPSWEALVAGTECVFCPPRSPIDAWKFEVATLSSSTLYLDREQEFRGYSLLIFDRRHAIGLESLTEQEYRDFTHDLQRSAKAIQAVFQPDLMNYASLGNGIPHVHWHIIPRYTTDGKWRRSPWSGMPPAGWQPTRLAGDDEYLALAAQIRDELQRIPD